MTRAQGSATIALLVLVCLGWIYGRFFPAEVKPQPWEYSATFVPGSQLEADLAIAGRAGWEVVSARWAQSPNDVWGYECIMRRPR